MGGGEPTLHPDATAIMREVKRRGWRGFLITNGTAIDERMATELVAMRGDRVRLSIHAGDRDTYRRVHGVDNFDKLKDFVARYDRLRREQRVADRCRLGVHFVLQRYNVERISEIVGFAARSGADDVLFEMIGLPAEGLALTEDDLRRAIRDLDLARRLPQKHNAETLQAQLEREVTAVRSNRPYRPAARCSVGFDSVHIRSGGNVFPCCFSDELLGNLRARSFPEIWHGAKARDFRKRLIRGEFAPYCYRVRCKLSAYLHD